MEVGAKNSLFPALQNIRDKCPSVNHPKKAHGKKGKKCTEADEPHLKQEHVVLSTMIACYTMKILPTTIIIII